MASMQQAILAAPNMSVTCVQTSVSGSPAPVPPFAVWAWAGAAIATKAIATSVVSEVPAHSLLSDWRLSDLVMNFPQQ